MPLDYFVGFQNWVGGDSRRDHLTSRGKTGRLSGLERKPSVALNCHNLHAALGTGHQAGAVASAPNGSRSIGNSVRRRRYNVVAGANRKVGILTEGIKRNRSEFQLSRIFGTIGKDDLRERTDVELALTADRQPHDAVFACCDRIACRNR
jgi:hypothetical protein